MKKTLLVLCTVLLLVTVLALPASAASYPSIFFDYTESSNTIVSGETGTLKFTIFPEYHNEKYYVEIYNSSNVLVASASNSYYNSDGTYIRDVSIRVDTSSLGLKAGTYKISYWLDFYSLNRWNEIPNRSTAYFEVVKNTCNGNHNFVLKSTSKEATCKEEGLGKYVCSTCNHTVYQAIPKAHLFSSVTEYNSTQHVSECTACGETVYSNHNWNTGTVTKSATCKEAGTKSFSCKDCSATKTETIPQLTTHTYSSCTSVNNSYHQAVCTVCNNTVTAYHEWNAGTVTKSASCKETGIKTFACKECSATKTETIALTGKHTYSNSCDTTCNVCNASRSISHKYKSEWSSNTNSHWKECSVCGNKKNSAAHTPGAEATETSAQTCTTCGQVLVPPLTHKHNISTQWLFDETGHYQSCSGCEVSVNFAPHAFDNACDPDCNTCGFTREVVHQYESTWSCDATGHWHVCVICQTRSDEASHIPGAAATDSTPQTCLTCNYELAPATASSMSFETALVICLVIVLALGLGCVIIVSMQRKQR